jgi:hypothetical protein
MIEPVVLVLLACLACLAGLGVGALWAVRALVLRLDALHHALERIAVAVERAARRGI